MLSKIVNRFPASIFGPRLIYRFSSEQEGLKKVQRKKRVFVSQFLFEKIMLQQLSLQHKVNIESYGFPQQIQAYLKMHYNKKLNKDDEGKKKQEGQTQGQSFQQKIKDYFIRANRVTAAIILTFVILFSQSGSDSSKESVQPNSRRVVNEHEMATLLASGNFNPEIIIVREVIYNDNNSRKVYQTVCMAKENKKVEVPISCIVNNLPLLLQRIESINFPYKVNFHYAAEDRGPEGLKIELGKIIIYGFIAYLLFKLRSGFQAGAKNGLGELLNMKKYEPIKPENIKTMFNDVAGMHEAKKQVTQFVDFLKNPDKYLEMGAKIPKGALLTGPPGTGKTLLARACAGQAGVPFFYVSGSEFVEKYVGLGASRVRNLFASAAKSAPSIIFIDQIDAIGKKRNSGPFSNEEKENTLNQLLVNMDGFDSKNKIIIMAATNLKESLDPALLRPGRFDRSIQIGLPNFDERRQILRVHLNKVKFSQKFTVDELAKKVSVLTSGFSGADLANICNQAAILAARAQKAAIDLPQFEKATERVMAGLQKRNLYSDQEKQCLAYYQCGRAVASWFTEGADPVIKISITPYSKQHSGYSHEIKDQMPIKTQTELFNKALCYLGGRAAQKHFKGYITSNGDSDLKKAKRIITYMVAKLGMSPLIGRIGFPDIQYMRKPYSNATQSKIDSEINRIFKECQQKVEQLITQKAQLVEKLKVLILEKQTLTHNTLKEVMGQRPHSDNENYARFLKDSEQKPQKEEEVTINPPSPQCTPKAD